MHGREGGVYRETWFLDQIVDLQGRVSEVGLGSAELGWAGALCVALRFMVVFFRGGFHRTRVRFFVCLRLTYFVPQVLRFTCFVYVLRTSTFHVLSPTTQVATAYLLRVFRLDVNVFALEMDFARPFRHLQTQPAYPGCNMVHGCFFFIPFYFCPRPLYTLLLSTVAYGTAGIVVCTRPSRVTTFVTA